MFDKMILYDLRNSFSKQTMPFNDQINSCSVYQKNATEPHNNVSDTRLAKMSEAEIVIDRGSDYAIIIPRLRS